jgi:hypothetical protein
MPTRPPTPDLFVMPPPNDEEEQTSPGTNLAMIVRAELERILPRMVAEIAALVAVEVSNALNSRQQRLEFAQSATEGTVEELKAEVALCKSRLALLERHCFPTEPCPPPTDGP